jgi:hypothetical protein
LAGDLDLLRDVVAAVGEGKVVGHAASTIPRKGIPHEGRASWQTPSNPVGDTNTVSQDRLSPGLRPLSSDCQCATLFAVFAPTAGTHSAGISEQLLSDELVDLPVYPPGLRGHCLTLHLMMESFQRRRR